MKSIGFVVKVGEAIYQSLSTLVSSLLGEISKIMQRYQPQILTHLHQIETFVYDFIVKMTGMNLSQLLTQLYAYYHHLLCIRIHVFLHKYLLAMLFACITSTNILHRNHIRSCTTMDCYIKL